MAFSNSEQPPVPQRDDTEKTARKGVAVGCFAMLLILAALTAAGIWAVRTLVSGIRSISANSGDLSSYEESAPAQEIFPFETEMLPVDGTFSEATAVGTLGITLGEFLDAYNAAVPEDYRLNPESEDCEISAYDNSCSYYFFLYETGPGDYVSVTLDCFGGKPSADQAVETVFFSDCYEPDGEPLEAPRAVAAGLRALLGSEYDAAEQALLTSLADLSQSGETDAAIECGGIEFYFSVYEERDGRNRLALRVWPD